MRVMKTIVQFGLKFKRKCFAKNDRTTCYWYLISIRWCIYALKSNIPALQLLWICLHLDDSEFCSLKACLKWTTQASDIFLYFHQRFLSFQCHCWNWRRSLSVCVPGHAWVLASAFPASAVAPIFIRYKRRY